LRCSGKVTKACAAHGIAYSITAPANPSAQSAFEAISENA